MAHAAIDVSDGLLADLGHILQRSGVAAELDQTALPRAALDAAPPDYAALAWDCLLAGGDDYEILFVAPPQQDDAVRSLGQRLGLALAAIGRIGSGPAGEILLRGPDGRLTAPPGHRGFDHFR
jgi:thiamine-monophosphate kinase